jgi:Lon protease-like protein
MSIEPNPEFPDHIGLMVLPWVTLFPGCLLPLHIFEDRYRKMCSLALSGNRVFAIAHADENGHCEPLGGLGIIRAGVTKDDGTIDIVLQGVSRVEFSQLEMKPYPQADIQILSDPQVDTESFAPLRKKLLKSIQTSLKKMTDAPKGFMDFTNSIEAPGAYADMVASALITHPVRRRNILRELDVHKRMELLLEYLLAERKEN